MEREGGFEGGEEGGDGEGTLEGEEVARVGEEG